PSPCRFYSSSRLRPCRVRKVQSRSDEFFNGAGIKTDHILIPFLNDWHLFLPGQFQHAGHGILIFGKIEFLKGNAFMAKELFRSQTPRSGR
ncbi:MAG: hypothetical protein WA974_09105, partial [Thermodesulfobacteriota bacterium]